MLSLPSSAITWWNAASIDVDSNKKWDFKRHICSNRRNEIVKIVLMSKLKHMNAQFKKHKAIQLLLFAIVWYNITFSEESRFCVGIHDGRGRVWRQRGEGRDIGFSVKRDVTKIVGAVVCVAIAYDSWALCWYKPVCDFIWVAVS